MIYLAAKMPNLGIPLNANGVRAVSGVMWETMKSSLPDSCFAGRDEVLNFAKAGGRPQQQQQRGDVELSSVNQAQGGEGAEGPPIPGQEGLGPGEEGLGPPGMLDAHGQAARKLQRESSMGSSSLAAAAEGPTDLITEWQAGWNVTNAIQVRNFVFRF